jgi:hypothetical protein
MRGIGNLLEVVDDEQHFSFSQKADRAHGRRGSVAEHPGRVLPRAPSPDRSRHERYEEDAIGEGLPAPSAAHGQACFPVPQSQSE